MRQNQPLLSKALLMCMILFMHITAKAQPHAGFTASPLSGCSPFLVKFTDISTGQPTNWKWQFGNGSVSTERNPSTTYIDPGTYTVKLVVSNATGKDSVEKISYITVYDKPHLSFFLHDISNCNPRIVSFDDQSTAGSGTIVKRLWDFGDGNVSSNQQTSHSYTTTGTFDVTLKVTNSYGCVSGETKSDAVLNEKIEADFSADIDEECHALPAVKFNNNSSGTASPKYLWAFGDGSTSAAISPKHKYGTGGKYRVLLKVQNSAGCFDTVLKEVVVSSNQSSFSIPASLCTYEQFLFQNTSVPQPIATFWTFGDGTTSSNLSPHKTYHQSGKFTVTLVNRFSAQCLDTTIRTITVSDYPAAFFTTRSHKKGAISISDRDVCRKQKIFFDIKNVEDSLIMPPYTVNFDNRSTGTKNSYEWDFGDNTKSTEENPSHTYKRYGNFKVTLKATNSAGCTSVYSFPDCVILQKQPVAQKVSNVVTTEWTFGNGYIVTENGTSTNYAYAAAGTYPITATVTYEDGYIETLIDSVTVYGPKAKFNYSDQGNCGTSSTINFIDASFSSKSDPLVFWGWDFGDNTGTNYISKQDSNSHHYTDTGLFIVKLKVQDVNGCEDSTIKKILVASLRASFLIRDTLICPGSKVDFVNTSVGRKLKYSWNLGDGTLFKSFIQTHTYTKPGAYLPILKVTDINGCRDSFAAPKPIIVSSPKADFNLNDTFSNCPPLEVDFTNKSSEYVSFLWSFGDGSTSTVLSPKHIYTYPGVYETKIVVKGNGTCSDSITKNITIKGPKGTLLDVYNKSNTICEPAVAVFKIKSENTTKYIWDYGDGKTLLTESDSVSHAYAPGFYIPKIILSDTSGCKVPVKGTDTIKVFTVTANAILTDQMACDSTTVLFKDSSFSNDLMTTHLWTFGDNKTSLGSLVAHTYFHSASYKIKLITRTQNGCTDTFALTKPVKVIESPVVTIQGDSTICEKSFFSVKGALVGRDTSLLTWVWNFGNGITETGQTPPSVSYNKPGNYNLSLNATSSNGCTGTVLKPITVQPVPPVDAGFDTSICKNASYTFNPSGADEYLWRSNPDLSCINCPNPVVHPESSSVFYVTGKSTFGCSAIDSVLISVIQPTHITSSGNGSVCLGQSMQLFAKGAQKYQWFPSAYLSDAYIDRPVLKPLKDTLINYTVVGSDYKNCFSDTASVQIKVYPLPQIQLPQKDIILAKGSSVRLNSSYSPDIIYWRWSPSQGLNSTTIPDPIASPQQTTTYRCEVVNAGGCISRGQVTIHIACNSSNYFIPNTFSPNGDGMNDVLYVRGTSLYGVKSFRIFNRLGQIVYERLNIAVNSASAGWDGTYLGKQMPADVYICAVELFCEDGTVLPVKASITLIR